MNGTIEIERKFLVADPSVLDGMHGETFTQGYLSVTPERTVRIRRVGDKAWLTIKSKPVGFTRREYEYAIPVADAEEMLTQLCLGTIITKVRHRIPYENHVWEVDRFIHPHADLTLAEVELSSEDEAVSLPSWLGREVTDDHTYSNSYLSTNPTED